MDADLELVVVRRRSDRAHLTPARIMLSCLHVTWAVPIMSQSLSIRPIDKLPIGVWTTLLNVDVWTRW